MELSLLVQTQILQMVSTTLLRVLTRLILLPVIFLLDSYAVFEDVGSNTGYSFTVHYDSSGWAFSPPPGFNALSDNKVKVISTGYPDSNTMVVDGGNWAGTDGPTQTRPLMYQTTGVPNDDSNLFLRSNRSKAEGGVYGDTLVDTWTADGPGVLSLFFQNNSANGAAPAISTFNFSSSDGVTCSEGSTWDLASSGALTITFTFPSAGSFEIEYFVADESPFDNHIIYYFDFAGKQSTWTADGQAAVILDGGTNVQVIKDDPDAQSHVEYQTNGGEGSIIEVNTDDNTLLITNSGDSDNRWIAENNAGTDFYVAPADAVPISQDYAWGKLQIINNKAQVTGIQKDDPGFLPVPAKDYSIKFPAVFPTGNEPDIDIPRGACVAAIVAAENSEGRSVKESNCFMPA